MSYENLHLKADYLFSGDGVLDDRWQIYKSGIAHPRRREMQDPRKIGKTNSAEIFGTIPTAATVLSDKNAYFERRMHDYNEKVKDLIKLP